MQDLVITVVIPTRNIARFLPRALASVAAQGGNWRLVAVDSASTDGTRELLGDFERAHPGRVQVLDEPKARLSEAVNLGIVAAEPGFVQWIGGDDAVAPGAHDHVRRTLAQHPDAQWLIGDIQFRQEDGTLANIGRATGWDRAAMLRGNQLYTAASFYTRDLAVRSGLCSPVLKRTMDYEWWFRMAYLTKPVVLGAVMAEFTLRNDAISGGQNAVELLRESIAVRQLYARFTPVDQATIAGVVARKYLPALAKARLRPLWLRLRERGARPHD